MMIFLLEVVKRTPFYVWIILVLLIMRGLNASRDNELSLPRMLIFPTVFIVWALEEVVAHFGFPGMSILVYAVFAVVGAPAGYVLYSHFRHFYQKDRVIYRTGTYMPMFVMMANFIVKYALNIAMSINPGVYGSMGFNLFYSLMCGFMVGLSLGGILQAYRAVTQLPSIS